MKKVYNVLADCRDMYEEEIIETILENRGIQDVERFLNPREEDLLPLDSLLYIKKAKDVVESGLLENKRFGVFFDCDTDGVCAGTIMTRYLRNFTDNVQTFINIGKDHGLMRQSLEQFESADILIIVDSLDEDTFQYERLFNDGKQVIVLDHHDINEGVPYDTYVTLVSSQRKYDNPYLSGAGVVWKFCCYLDKYFERNYSEFFADLAACGILADVCDVSENSTENRYIVNEGLNNLCNSALRNIVGSYEFNSKSVLFSVAPLINATCRVGKNDIAMRMFLSDDLSEIKQCIKELMVCKENQTEQVEQILSNVYKDFEKQSKSNVLYTIIDTDFGISGLIGNKCLNEYNKPMFILKDCGDKYRGSMRSVGYANFRTLCNETELATLNGHEEASGIVIEKDHLNDFIEAVNKRLDTIEQTTTDEITVDCELNVADITRTLVDKIKKLNKISGEGFKPITIKISNIYDYVISNFKSGKHLVIYPLEHDTLQLIEWNTKADYGLLEDCSIMNTPIEVVGELDSGWFGKRFMLKLIISDLRVV